MKNNGLFPRSGFIPLARGCTAAPTPVMSSERRDARDTLKRLIGPGFEHRLGLLTYRFWDCLDRRIPVELVSEIVASALQIDLTSAACHIGNTYPEWDRPAKTDILGDLERLCGVVDMRGELPAAQQLQSLQHKLRNLLAIIYHAPSGPASVLPLKVTCRLVRETAASLPPPYRQSLLEQADEISNASTRMHPLQDALVDLERMLLAWLSRI